MRWSATPRARVAAYKDARIVGLRNSLALLAGLAILALFFAQSIPVTQPGSRGPP